MLISSVNPWLTVACNTEKKTFLTDYVPGASHSCCMGLSRQCICSPISLCCRHLGRSKWRVSWVSLHEINKLWFVVEGAHGIELNPLFLQMMPLCLSVKFSTLIVSLCIHCEHIVRTVCFVTHISCHLFVVGLTHLPLIKMAAISQTTSSNTFSWIKSFVFRSNFTKVCSQKSN